MIGRLTWLELRRASLSPVPWLALAVVQLFAGFLLVAFVEEFLQIQGRVQGPAPGVTAMITDRYLPLVGFLLLIVTPSLTMRSIAEERRSGSLLLLRAAPVSPATVVIAKFMAVFSLYLLHIGLALLPIALIATGTDLDGGRIAAAALGLVLMAAGFAAVGIAASASTSEPVIAAMLSLAVLLVAWMLKAFADAPGAGELVARLAPLVRLEAFSAGEVRLDGIVYFLSMVLVALSIAVDRLRAERSG